MIPETLADRIRFIRKHFQLTQAQLGEHADISKAAVSQWERSLAKPDVTVVLKLQQRLHINPNWLIHGAGEWQSSGTNNRHDDVPVPFFKQVAFAAGHGTQLDDEDNSPDQLTFKQYWLDEKGYQAKHLLVVFAKGDSMSPRICDGDILLVKTDEPHIIDGAVYANYAGNAKVKRLSLRYDGALIMSSDNPNPQYKEEEIPADHTDQLNIIGRVVWTGGDIH